MSQCIQPYGKITPSSPTNFMSDFDLVIELPDLFDHFIKLSACIVDLSSATLHVKIFLGLYVVRQKPFFFLIRALLTGPSAVAVLRATPSKRAIIRLFERYHPRPSFLAISCASTKQHNSDSSTTPVARCRTPSFGLIRARESIRRTDFVSL